MIHTSLRFAFFGTPQLSADILETLKRHNLVPAVIVTNPDRPQGRKMVLTPPPVKRWALANNIPCLQPEKLDSVFNQQLITYNSQLFVVVAYGSILPKELLAIPEKGSLNIHYSLLPKYRGASPIESQILADDKETGVSILLLDEEMDHGPVVAERKVIVNSWPLTASELRKKSNEVAGEMLAEILPDWISGKIEAVPQDHTQATYTKKFTKADGELNLSDDPYKNYLKIQALESSIGTYFFHSPSSSFKEEVPSRRGGGVRQTPSQSPSSKEGEERLIRISIKSAEFTGGKLVITRVVPEGKKEMGYEEFLRGMK